MKAEQEKDKRLWLYWAAFLIVTVGCYAVLRYVVPQGDDLYYGRWGRLSVGDFAAQVVQHYQLANGRNLVHIFAGILLASQAGIEIARALIAVLLGSIVFNGLRLADAEIKGTLAVAAMLICGIFMLPAELTRQSVYWITGAMNYVLPLAILLEYWVLLRRSLQGGRWTACCVFALLAGLTVEQISMMAFGLTVLMLCEILWVRKEKLRRIMLAPLVLTFFGMLTVLLAPGNAHRAEVTKLPVSGGVLDMVRYNILNLRRSFLFGEAMYPIHFLTLGAIVCYLFVCTVKRRKLLHGLVAAVAALTTAGWFWLPQQDKRLLSYGEVPVSVDRLFLAVLAGYLLCSLYAVCVAFAEKQRVPLYAWILGVGSQVMMLVSPTVGPRTMLCCAGMMLLVAACLIQKAPYLYMLGVGCVYGWHIGQAWVVIVLAGTAVLFLLRKFQAARMIGAMLCCVPLLFCAWLALKDTYDGYKLNYAVYQADLAVLDEIEATDTTVYNLRKLPRPLYGWVMPYDNDYYTAYFKQYYSLPRRSEIEWTE